MLFWNQYVFNFIKSCTRLITKLLRLAMVEHTTLQLWHMHDVYKLQNTIKKTKLI